MKNKIYLLVLGVLILTGALVLIMYYSRTTELINFKDEINTWDAEWDYEKKGEERIMYSLNFSIGTLALENEGMTEYIYEFPYYVACIDFVNSINVPEIERLDVLYREGNKLMSSNEEISIQKDQTLFYDIIARMPSQTSYQDKFKADYYAKEKINSVSIFRIPQKESNPIREDYPVKRINYNSCIDLRNNEKPVKVINVV
ncbi:MAG: hypothetical protein ABIB79_04715 [archaeon]